MDQQKIMKISSIVIGIIIAVLLTIMGFKVLSGSFTRASDMEPRDVVVSTILENSAKLSWSTGIETQGVVEYGTTPTALNFFSPEPQKIKSHIADLTLLTPNTSYYFQIRIGDKIDLVYTIDEDRWNGNSRIQLKIKDFRKIE